jgi:hypothetical protein
MVLSIRFLVLEEIADGLLARQGAIVLAEIISVTMLP